MEICVEGLYFSAAHRLLHHPGKCSHMHGHNFHVTCKFYGNEIDPDSGMIVDFGDIGKLVKDCVDSLDHCSILNVEDKQLVKFLQKMENRVVIMGNEPTAEEIAKYLFSKIEQVVDTHPEFHKQVCLIEIQIWETPKYSAKYSLDDKAER